MLGTIPIGSGGATAYGWAASLVAMGQFVQNGAADKLKQAAKAAPEAAPTGVKGLS